MVTTRLQAHSLKNNNVEVVKNGVNDGEKYKKNGATSKITNDDKTRKRTEIVVFLSLLLDLLGFTVILPLFPALLDYYSKHDNSGLYNYLLNLVSNFQTHLGVPSRFNSVLFGGLLGSLFSFLQFLSSPLIGALSDIYGRKITTIFTLVGIASSYALWALSSNFTIFVFARIVGGLSKGNISLAYTIMTDVSDSTSRARGMALIGIAFSIGFIVGPAVGAGFSKWGTTGWFATSAMYAFTLAVLNVIFFSIFFTETLPQHKPRKSLADGVNEALDFINPVSLFSFKAVKDLDKTEQKQLKHLARIYFLFLFLYSGLEFTLTFVTHHHHNYTSMDQGKMFIFIGVLMTVMQGGFMRRMKPGSEKQLATVGFIMMIPSFIIVGMSSTSFLLYLGLAFYSLGSSIMVPCLTAMASKNGPVYQKGTILGIWRSLGALARVLGPIITCATFWSLGASKCYTLIGLLLVIPLAMLRSC